MERISSKHYVNGKLLKRFMLQLQRENNIFKYKLNQLSKVVQTIEEELQSERERRGNQTQLARNHMMSVMPEHPFITRDEVIMYDNELKDNEDMQERLVRKQKLKDQICLCYL